MRLLLDEHFSKRVAAEMRVHGYDVVAVSERDDLRGLSDAELFAEAHAAGFAIVTQDYADFVALVREAALAETEHTGVVFVPKSLWQSIRDLDRLVVALAHLLDEGLSVGGTVWLSAAE